MKRPTPTFGTVELDGIQSTSAVVFEPSTQMLTNIGFPDRPVTEGHDITHLIVHENARKDGSKRRAPPDPIMAQPSYKKLRIQQKRQVNWWPDQA